MTMAKLIYFSRSRPYSNSSGGGQRRTYQVLETIKDLGKINVIRSTRPDIDDHFLKEVNSGFRKRFLKNYITGGDYKLWNEERRQAVFFLASVSRKWAKNQEILTDINLAFVEDPIYFKPLVLKLSKFKIPVVAVSQNIETLSYKNESIKKQLKLFSKELNVFKKCELTITISKEESLLLDSFGINSFYFPYYPPHDIEDFLLEIRTKRQQQQKKDFIILGNAGNVNTRCGMLKIIEFWRKNKLSSSYGQLLVCGFKTDIYLPQLVSDADIDFLGPLDDKSLSEKLSRIKACICYQETGGGALTRVAELLTAGVPVVANLKAARSYYNVNGLIEFRDLNDLENALKQVGRNNNPIPVPFKPNSSNMITQLNELISKGER
jgi:glycosyltransferase involved in cell wall biosynthesis